MSVLCSSLVGEHLEVHETISRLGLVLEPLRQRLKGMLPDGCVIALGIHSVKVSELLVIAESGTEPPDGGVNELAPGDVLVVPNLSRADVNELLQILATLIFRSNPDPVGQHLCLRSVNMPLVGPSPGTKGLLLTYLTSGGIVGGDVEDGDIARKLAIQ
jgi:hypothetical protein